MLTSSAGKNAGWRLKGRRGREFVSGAVCPSPAVGEGVGESGDGVGAERVRLGERPERLVAADAPQEQPRHRVDDDGNQQQQQTQFDEHGAEKILVGLHVLIGEPAGDRVTDGEEREADLVAVTDEHGHRHRLAQGSAQGEEGAGDDARSGVGQHHSPDRLPARRPQGQRAFALGARHRLADVEADGGDIGHDHHRQDQPGGEQPAAAGVRSTQESDDALHDRRQHEDAPETVDHAGDGGEHLDEERRDSPQPNRGDLGQVSRRAHAQRQGDDHGDQRCHHRSVHERERAEHGRVGVGVPVLTRQEAKPDRVDRQPGALEQDQEEEHGHEDDRAGRRLAKEVEAPIDQGQRAGTDRAHSAGRRWCGYGHRYPRTGLLIPQLPALICLSLASIFSTSTFGKAA